MKSIDEKIAECDSTKSCSKCSNYMDCLIKFKSKELDTEKNNPSMINYEINGFDFNVYKEENENTKKNYKIDISEANQVIITKALISLYQLSENDESTGIIRSALEKFSAEPNSSAEIFKSKGDNKYHLVFECSDCEAINDSTEYINGDSITIYCRYCGKRHKFDINKENDND